MSTERQAGEFQSTTHLRDLDERHSVLAGIEKAADARALIASTFAERPDLVIIYQGVAKGLSQREIARELAARGFRPASLATVNHNIAKLDELWFIKKPQKGRHVVRPGWEEEFNLSRELGRILRKHKVPPL